MNNTSGIDKLGLYVSLDSIRVKGKSLIKTHDIKALNEETEAPFLFYDLDGKEVRGSKGMINTETFNFTVSPRGALLQFNPSKPYHDYELCGSSEQLIERTEIVIKQLEECGVYAEWEEAKITRIDIAKNIKLDKALGHYTRCLGVANFSRSRRQLEYADGYMTGNNSRAFVVYNKSLESKLKESGITRGELQLRKSIATKSIARNYKDKDLITNGLEVYKDTITKTFSITKNEIIDINTIDYNSLLVGYEILKKQHKRNAYAHLLKLMGYEQLLESIGFEGFCLFLKDIGFDKKRQRLEKQGILKKAYELKKQGFLRKESKAFQEITLITELTDKLLCA